MDFVSESEYSFIYRTTDEPDTDGDLLMALHSVLDGQPLEPLQFSKLVKWWYTGGSNKAAEPSGEMTVNSS